MIRKIFRARSIIKEYFQRAINASDAGLSKAEIYDIGAGLVPEILELLNVEVKMSGLENLIEGPGIIVSNHTSLVDIISLASFDGRKYFAAKKELFNSPFFGETFGQGLKAVGLPEVDRSNAREALKKMDEAVEMIKTENSISQTNTPADSAYLVVFPEGTRSKSESYEMLQFKKTAFKLAVKHNIPIIPVASYGARNIIKKGSFRIKPGTIYLKICEPIYSDSFINSEEQLNSAQIVNKMSEVAKKRIETGIDELKNNKVQTLYKQ
ncbi:lysophospholipid acyltransferase family protein [Bacteroidota bacterium]